MDAARIVPWLMLSIVGMWISHATAIATLAAGLQAHFVWIQSICMTAYLLLDWLLIPRWGMGGAVTGRLVATVLAPALTYWLVKRLRGFRLNVFELRGKVEDDLLADSLRAYP